MLKTLLLVLPLLSLLALMGCAAIPAAATATPASEPSPAIEAAAVGDEVVLVFRRGGGIAGVDESWTMYGDGRVVDASGTETNVDDAAVAALVEQARSAGFFEQQLSPPKMSSCRDCFTYQLTISAAEQKNSISFEDAQDGVPDSIWDLAAAVQALVAGDQRAG